jgi:di/tricarboxylate transporter
MAFSICLGGNMTLMGASSKGVLNGLMESYGLTAFNFFDYTPVGVVLFIIGLLYFAFAGYKLLPVVDVAETAETAQKQVELRTDKMTYAVAAFAS